VSHYSLDEDFNPQPPRAAQGKRSPAPGNSNAHRSENAPLLPSFQETAGFELAARADANTDTDPDADAHAELDVDGDAGASTANIPVSRILGVGLEEALADRLCEWAAGSEELDFSATGSIKGAWHTLENEPIDLVVMASHLPDGSTLAFAEQLANRPQLTHAALVADQPSVELATDAMRAGVADLIDGRLDWPSTQHRLGEVLTRQTRDRVQARRVERLHHLCKRLNTAREAVSDQVDTLCHDLVTAYQDLAHQLDQAMHGTEFTAVLDQELDLDTLIRRTLEFLVRKLGNTHGAVYLPSNADEYSVAGYISYEAADGPADVLLEDLADRLAPPLGQQYEPVHLTSDHQLRRWVGKSLGPLSEQHLLSFPCQHEDETLAVVALFRDAAEPFDPQAREIAQAVGPRLGEALGRMIRIHHRHLPEPEAEADGRGDPMDLA